MLTVGEILKKQRENQGVKLTDVEKEIRVREKFLKAIENNNWDFFSSKVYVTGIIKAYAKLLDLDQEKITAFFRREYEKKEQVEFKKRISSHYLKPETKKVILAALIFVFLLFFGYFGFQLKLYLTPPKVTIVSPVKNNVVAENKIKITGQTEKEAVITIFGERVYQNKEGIFEYDFPLRKGKNELTIEAIGPNGKRKWIKKVFQLE